MYKKGKTIIKKNKKIIENFSYLSVLQIFNLLLPLITYPYLIRILGANIYGEIIFAQAIIGYLAIIVNFGFNISATKNISINKDNRDKISEIVSSVLIIKTILFVATLLVLFFVFHFLIDTELDEFLFYYTMHLCLYELIFPVWYFQGMEKMKFITIFSLISKLVFVFFIFILINTPKDYLLVPIINGLGTLIAGLTALFFVFKKDNILFKWQTRKKIFYYTKDSFVLFLSNAMVMTKEKTNILFIGLFLQMTEVAYYDLAVKISNLLRTPFMTIRDAIFPSIAISLNRKKYIKIGFGAFLLSIVTYFLLIIFSKPIILILGGEKMISAQQIVSIVGLTIPLGVISMFLGSGIIIFESAKKYTISIVISLMSFVVGLSLIYFLELFSLYYLILILIISLITEILIRAYFFTKK